MRGPRSNDTPVPTSAPATWILVSDSTLQQKEPRLPGEGADSKPGQGMDKLSLEHLVGPESEEGLTPPTVKGYVQGTRQPALEQVSKQNNGIPQRPSGLNEYPRTHTDK